MPSTKRRKVGAGAQRGFEFSSAGKAEVQEARPAPVAVFEDPSPDRLFVGDVRLREYLKSRSLGWVVELRAMLRRRDWSLLTQAYPHGGRTPYHPAVVLGLVVYGLLTRQSSLRELEVLAVRDVGAWWICGGACPDHSTIGRFVLRHASTLTEEFFVSLTHDLVRELRLGPGAAAGDGTVIEAAASHLKTLKLEAARQAEAEAAQEAQTRPDDAAAQARAAAAQQVAAVAEERTEERERKQRGGAVQVCPREPEAVVQPLKNGAVRPAYKPSVLVHESGLIVGQGVDPSNEVACVAPMLAQHQVVFGALPTTSLFDAGYHSRELLELYVALDADVLCPSGRATGAASYQKARKGQFPKSAFRFEEAADHYVCPAGQLLRPRWTGVDSEGRRYTRYGESSVCRACPQRGACTASKKGRGLNRYQGDELKEAMAEVLAQPAARARFQRRPAIVEPTFAALKYRQGLQRFRRRGAVKVRLEFALHCIAFNLGRAISLRRRMVVVFAAFRLQGQPWRIGWIALALA